MNKLGNKTADVIGFSSEEVKSMFDGVSGYFYHDILIAELIVQIRELNKRLAQLKDLQEGKEE